MRDLQKEGRQANEEERRKDEEGRTGIQRFE